MSPPPSAPPSAPPSPPPQCSALYRGSTTHTRRKPLGNRFTYRVYMAYVDLDELHSGRLENWPLFSSRTAWSLLSLLPRDHMLSEPRAGPLLARVRDAVHRETGVRPAGPVRLLTNLRVLGVEFNPVSFYYVFNAAGSEVDTLVAEVSNFPWFEQHNYVVAPLEALRHGKGLRRFAGHPKAFHVSPFMDIAGVRYEWLVGEPGDRLQARVHLKEAEEGTFLASLDAERMPWSVRNLVMVQVMYPLHTLFVMLGILYEAGKLFKRGLTFFPHPHGTETALSIAVAKVVLFGNAVIAAWKGLTTRPAAARR